MTPKALKTAMGMLARRADLLSEPILSREAPAVGASGAGLLARLGLEGLGSRARAWLVEQVPEAPRVLAAGALALTLAPATGCEREWAGDCKGGFWKCAIEVGMDPDEDGITPEDDCEEGNPDVGALYVGRDRDSDGVASMEDYHVAPGCKVPQGYSAIFEDCDDYDPDKADVQPWVEDLDGDGYGAGEPEERCASEDGYSLVGGDCDDTDADVHPEAAEIAEDGVDNDCDGRADDQAPEGSYTTSDATVTLDGTGDDELSSGFAAISDFDGQGGTDLAVGSPGAENSAGEAVGAVDILAGPITGAEDVEDQEYTRLWGADDGDRAGAAMAGLGDIDGDAYADFIVGAPGVVSSTGDFGGGSGPEGAAYVVYGPVELGSTVMLEDSRHVAVLSASESGGRLGTAVAGIGDITGDGLPDFAVGAPNVGGGRWSDMPSQAGMVYLLESPPDHDQEIGDVAFASLEGEEEHGWLGATVAGGKDLNGDGTPDLVVGAPTDRVGAMAADYNHDADAGGIAWVLLDSPSGLSSISPWATTWVTGPATSSFAGAVTLLDDLNGDGFADLALGAPMDDGAEDDAGAVYLLSGAAMEDLEPSAVADSNALLGVVNGPAADTYLGWAVAGAGDIDEDGRADLLVGAPGSDSEKGSAWVLTGATDGDQLGDAFLGIESPTPWGWAGRALGAADLNGLGRSDILIGMVEDSVTESISSSPGHLTLFLTDGL